MPHASSGLLLLGAALARHSSRESATLKKFPGRPLLKKFIGSAAWIDVVFCTPPLLQPSLLLFRTGRQANRPTPSPRGSSDARAKRDRLPDWGAITSGITRM